MKALEAPLDPARRRFLPAARLVPSSQRTRTAARNLTVAFALFVLFLALAPWRQNLPGTGQVIAYTPDDRPQTIAATIAGRVLRWHVIEGQSVEAGELLVELADNDPLRVERLELERDAASARLSAYQEKVLAYRDGVEALRRARTAQIDAAAATVRVARQTLRSREESMVGAEASVETARVQRERLERLSDGGLASRRDRELAELADTNARATLASARAQLRAAEQSVQTERATLERVRAATEAELRSAEAILRTAETEVESAKQALASIESRLAQQRAQEVRAPRAGVIHRIYAQQGGVQVSRGQELATLVPFTKSRAVELIVDGNDAALINPGRHVRIQFEGWPAVQFAGWPSVAVGTFGGRVSFVDPTSDGRGDFRVVVVPDPEDDPWPEPRFLRQGTRAKGWVLLDEVRVGFEVWRRFNGFPPSYERAPEVGAPYLPSSAEAR